MAIQDTDRPEDELPEDEIFGLDDEDEFFAIEEEDDELFPEDLSEEDEEFVLEFEDMADAPETDIGEETIEKTGSFEEPSGEEDVLDGFEALLEEDDTRAGDPKDKDFVLVGEEEEIPGPGIRLEEDTGGEEDTIFLEEGSLTDGRGREAVLVPEDEETLEELEEEIFGDLAEGESQSAGPDSEEFEEIEGLLFSDAEELEKAAAKTGFDTEKASFSEDGPGMEGLEDFEPEGEGRATFGVPDEEERKRWGDPSIFGDSGEEEVEPFLQESGVFDTINEDEELQIVGDADELMDVGPDEEGNRDGTQEEGDVDDPIYGAETQTSRPEDYAGSGQEPDTRDLEKILVDDEGARGPEEPVVVGAPVLSPWPRRFMVAGMAASILVLVGVGMLALAPRSGPSRKLRGFLGLRNPVEPVRMVVDTVDRPRIETVESLPEIPGAGRKVAARPGPSSSRGEGFRALLAGIGSGVLKTVRIAKLCSRGISKAAERSLASLPAGDPVAAVPGPAPEPSPEPRNPEGNPPVPVPVPVAALPESVPGELVPEPGKKKMDPALSGFGPLLNAVHRGTQALAKLRNGNFFIGRVQKIVESELVLNIEGGEVTLIPSQLSKVIPLAHSELKLLRRAKSGVVRLKNNEKIRGTVLEDLEDFITIEDEGARIYLPRSSVLAVVRKEKGKIVVGEDEEWLQDEVNLPVPEEETDSPLPVVEEDNEDDPSRAVRIKLDIPGTGKKEKAHASPPSGR